MKKQLHGIILILIGILSFIASVSGFISGILELYETLVSSNFNLSAIQLDEVVTSAISLIFGALELSFGIKLFQSVNKNEHFNTYKQIPALINTIISQFLVFLIYQVIMSFINVGLMPESISTQYIMINVILYIVISFAVLSVQNLIKKRKLIGLILVSLFAGACSVAFYFINLSLIFTSDLGILDTISNCVNLVVLILIVAFAITSLIYYSSRPDLLYADTIEGEDSEVIASKEKYDVIKIYLNRAKNPTMNTFIKIINIILGVTGIAFGVLFLFNNYYDFILTFDLNEFVNNFVIFDMFLLFDFIGAFLAFFGGIDLIVCVFKTDGARKHSNLQGMYYLPILLSAYYIIDFIYLLIDSSILSFSTFDFNGLAEKVGIHGALFLLSYLIRSLYNKKVRPVYSRISDAIKNGEPYCAFAKEAFTLCLLDTIPGLMTCVAFLFKSNFQDISYYLLIIIVLICLLSTWLEVKFPTEEYVITRRRKLTNKE